MRYLAWLWNSTGGFRLNIAIRVLAGLGRVSLGLLMVWLSKRFIDETIVTGSETDIVRMVVFLVLTVVGGIVLRLLFYYMTASAVVRKSNALRLEAFEGLFSRSLYGGDKLHSGDVASRLSKDIESVSTTAMDTLPQMLVTGLQLVGAFLLMRWFDARLAWALLLFTPVAIVLGKLVSRKLRNMTLEIRDRESRIQMQVQEGVEFNAVLRSLESEEVLKRTRFTTISRFALGSAFGLGYLFAFVWGALGLRDGAITVGMLTSFLQLVGQIQGPILSILNMVPQVVHSTASIDRLQELRGAPVVRGEGVTLDGIPGIRAEGLRFGYGDGAGVIDGFSHDFKPGSKTAIMGTTGAGKTTFFRLLLGLAHAGNGHLSLYSGTSEVGISEVTRSNFVYVPQGNTLLSGTVRFNLQLANPEAGEDEMWKALHDACADFVLDMPQGLDTELGERGLGLSEGQAQRIAVARGLLRPGNVWLFDEVGSALDEETERELFRRLFDAYPGKTMLFVTHRGTVAGLCDEILTF